MQTLLKATDDIDAMAVNTAMHLKALADSSDWSKQLLESVIDSFVGRLTGKGFSRIAFDPPTQVKEAFIKVLPPIEYEVETRTKFGNGISQKIWDCISTFYYEVDQIENVDAATRDDNDAQRVLTVVRGAITTSGCGPDKEVATRARPN